MKVRHHVGCSLLDDRLHPEANNRTISIASGVELGKKGCMGGVVVSLSAVKSGQYPQV